MFFDTKDLHPLKDSYLHFNCLLLGKTESKIKTHGLISRFTKSLIVAEQIEVLTVGEDAVAFAPRDLP